jgi:hypothetical protein
VYAVLARDAAPSRANELASRLVDRFGAAVPGLEALGLGRVFPSPSALANADLTRIGLRAELAEFPPARTSGSGETPPMTCRTVREKGTARPSRDAEMLLRMPQEMVRELFLHYGSESAPGHNRDRLLGMIVGSVCEVPVTAVTVYETSHARARCARIAVAAQHSERFARIFPDPRRLKDPAPGLVTSRLVSRRCATRR